MHEGERVQIRQTGYENGESKVVGTFEGQVTKVIDGKSCVVHWEIPKDYGKHAGWYNRLYTSDELYGRV